MSYYRDIFVCGRPARRRAGCDDNDTFDAARHPDRRGLSHTHPLTSNYADTCITNDGQHPTADALHRRPKRCGSIGVAVALAVLATACGGGSGTTPAAPNPSAPSAGSNPTPRTISLPYAPTIDPANFTTTIDNPYFPLVPGTRLVYEGDGPEGHALNVTEVTRETKKVLGVDVVVVHDTVSLNGKPEEETVDWYAQDKQGNVWYFGEDTTKLTGPKAGKSGSFSAGVDGALPGIIMLGAPKVGDQYRQEYYKAHAEDTAEVLSLTGTETAPYGGPRKDLLVTKDVNPLDPAAAIENKYFAKGIGFIAVKHVTGPAEHSELVKIEKF